MVYMMSLPTICQNVSNETDPNPIQTSESTRAKSRKSRVFKFFKFLRNHFSSILLDESSVMLDVASGKGDLSWMIANTYDISCVCVDPRSTNHSSLIRSFSFLQQNPHLISERSIEGSLSFQPLALLFHELNSKKNSRNITDWNSPINFQIYFNDALVQAVRKEYEVSGTWSKFWSSSALCHCISAEAAWNHILNTKLIVGFHPDQATESIIDFALFLRIPFAIVPCCVFPSEFPHRLWKDERVRTHADFVDYLLAKHPKIRLEKLDFDYCEMGKNTVLFMRPE